MTARLRAPRWRWPLGVGSTLIKQPSVPTSHAWHTHGRSAVHRRRGMASEQLPGARQSRPSEAVDLLVDDPLSRTRTTRPLFKYGIAVANRISYTLFFSSFSPRFWPTRCGPTRSAFEARSYAPPSPSPPSWPSYSSVRRAKGKDDCPRGASCSDSSIPRESPLERWFLGSKRCFDVFLSPGHSFTLWNSS